MATIERDPTDLGLPAELSAAEFRELRERSRRPVESESVPALPTQRREAMEFARRACGWDRPSRSETLSRPCGLCGAESAQWCRRRGRRVAGFLCEGRGK